MSNAKSATADVDNRVKLLFDLLVTEGVITDDRFITGFATALVAEAF